MIEKLLIGELYNFKPRLNDESEEQYHIHRDLMNVTEPGFRNYAVKIQDNFYLLAPYRWSIAKGGKVYEN